MKISVHAVLAFIALTPIAIAQWKVDPKGDYITVHGMIKDSTICFSVSPESKSTYFGENQEQWELNLLESDKDSYTFQMRYLRNDKVIESITRRVTRGQFVDFEIPKGQSFQSFFSSRPKE